MHTHSPYVKFATLYENKLVITQEPIDGKRHRFNVSEYHKNPTNAKYTGTLSNTARKKIDKKLHGWVYTLMTAKSNRKGKKRTQRRKPVFCTLTLPAKQNHDDKVIKSKCLELFIKRLQYHCGVKHYFWRAEVQENNNLHFHLIFDLYIDKKVIQKHWNEVLIPLGYIDEFEAKHGHRNPPTTQIKKLFSHSANIFYMLKYCGKEHKGRLINGALFRFSKSLDHVKPLKIILCDEDANKLRKFVGPIKGRVFVDDFFAVVYFKRSVSLLPFFDSLGESFSEVTNFSWGALYPENTQKKNHLHQQQSQPIAFRQGYLDLLGRLPLN